MIGVEVLFTSLPILSCEVLGLPAEYGIPL